MTGGRLWTPNICMVNILKPGQDEINPEDDRPIRLLTVSYILLERLLLNRIRPAGFRL